MIPSNAEQKDQQFGCEPSLMSMIADSLLAIKQTAASQLYFDSAAAGAVACIQSICLGAMASKQHKAIAAPLSSILK